jgi:Ca-activated chloride channel family protein
MNEHQQQIISPDDPKLTAYALGELSGEERAAVEAALKGDAAAQAAVNEIRALAAQLEGALVAEPLTEASTRRGVYTKTGFAMDATSAPRSRSEHEAKPLGTAAADDPYRKKAIRFPYVLIGSLAAACFAVMVALHEDPRTKLAAHKATQIPPTGTVTNGGLGGESLIARTSDRETLAESRVPKLAGMFSVEMPPDEQAGRSVLLVKDAEEAAAIPVPEVNALPIDTTLSSSAVATLPTPPAFVGEPKPIKTALTDAAAMPAITGAIASAPVHGTAELPPASAVPTEQGTRGDPGALTNNASAPAVNQTFADNSVVVSEEPIRLSAFMVSAGRERTAYYGASLTRGGGPAGSRLLTAREEVAASGSMYGRMDVTAPAGPRMNFRAKSTAPARNLFNTEAYAFLPESDFFRVRSAPLSTFSIDVDTASYANVRRFLDHGQRPPKDAVRVEEMVNYFNYRYAPPTKEVADPFAASVEIATAPWNPAHRLVRIGLKGREVATEDRPAANLVFLLDVSGSMSAENKLPLVKESLRLLVEKLRADDRVAIVTYAGSSGLALPSTAAAQKKDILEALDDLRPGGSTNGAMGIQLAYDIAKANVIAGGTNRVILCTDGDFNVGMTSDGALTRLIEDKAKSGVFLTVLGFGMGNLKDSTLERLADKGNGNYGYIDSRAEAHKLLVEQAGGTLVTIAKDVKLQVEFNPALAQAYRLIGYENRALKKEDFNNDKADAGEIGAGHTVTALYEIVPARASAPESPNGEVDALRYRYEHAAESGDAGAQAFVAKAAADASKTGPQPGGKPSEELLTLKIRFKEPTVDVSRKIEIPAIDTGAAFEAASKDFKFAAAVASLGLILRESAHIGKSDYDRVIAWAEAGKGDDADGRRGEFIELVRKARALSAE